MLGKRLKAKQAKPAVRSSARAARKPKRLHPEFTPDEIATVEQQLIRHQQSERAWQRLASPPDSDDRWSEVEEHLLGKSQREAHAERRWKYFAK